MSRLASDAGDGCRLLVLEGIHFGHDGDELVGGERAEAADLGEVLCHRASWGSVAMITAISASNASTWWTICSKRYLQWRLRIAVKSANLGLANNHILLRNTPTDPRDG
jgi:hypothetical protein